MTTTCSYRRRVLGATLVALTALLGACSGDDASSGGVGGAAPPVAPGVTVPGGSCALLSRAEVAEVLGLEVEPSLIEDTSPERPMPFSLCRWEAPGAVLEVSVIESPERYQNRLEHVRGRAEEGTGPEPEVVDLGEGAFVVGRSLGSSGLVSSVLDGARTVEVNLDLGGEETTEQVVDLAGRVVARA